MLNELLMVERGARAAGLKMVEGHPDLKDAGRIPTLLVRLDVEGAVSSVQPLPAAATAWTLRSGQHNSFPFLKAKAPLWVIPEPDARLDLAISKKSGERREALLAIADDGHFNKEAFQDWPGAGFLARLRARYQDLAVLQSAGIELVRATIHRFVIACESSGNAEGVSFLRNVAEKAIQGVHHSATKDWLDVAAGLLIGTAKIGKRRREGSAALLVEADGYHRSIADPKTRAEVAEALRRSATDDTGTAAHAVCALTGSADGPLLSGNFPQPNLPIIGPTYLFAKNRDIPANDRYGRFAGDAFRIGRDEAIRLEAAIRALTSPDRRGLTWRGIPGEVSKYRDLLLALVEQAPDVPIIEAVADDDFSEERPTEDGGSAGSVAAYEKRAQRLISAIEAKVGADFRKTPVRLLVLRKVDRANRKAVYARAPTVGDLYHAATDWVAGERNVPMLTLPVLRWGEGKPCPMLPPHVAPLGLIAFSRTMFNRGGIEHQEIKGLPSAEALSLFLDRTGAPGLPAWRSAERVVRLVLSRRSSLVMGTAHTMRRDVTELEKLDHRKALREALRTVTVLGVLLHKLGRTKETYMNDPAFKLGQLLAAADMVHAGYCADVRAGDIPPSLLGNQVFAMAQTAPVKALATLCQRWKPYGGWANRASRDRTRVDNLVASRVKDDERRGWEIRKALRHAREVGPLAEELAVALGTRTVDDVFRAELLLGYIAGLPRARTDDENGGVQGTGTGKREDQ